MTTRLPNNTIMFGSVIRSLEAIFNYKIKFGAFDKYSLKSL